MCQFFLFEGINNMIYFMPDRYKKYYIFKTKRSEALKKKKKKKTFQNLIKGALNFILLKN
jgi:hypothetical protein